MDILADVLDRVHLGGTLLFHYELGRPWSLALPAFPDAVFHYLNRGSATLALEKGRKLRMVQGDFVVVTRGEPHLIYSDRNAKPFPLLELDRRPAHLGVVRHGGSARPLSTMICGHFTLSGPSRTSILELLPPILLLKPTEDHEWLQTILQRIASESALDRPGQRAVLSRMTEVLFVDVLRSWIKSLRPGEGGWLGAMADPAYRTGASIDSRTTRSALDTPRPWAPRGARSVSLLCSLYEVGWSTDAPLPDRAADARGGIYTRIKRRRDSANYGSRRLRNRSRVFEIVLSVPGLVTEP